MEVDLGQFGQGHQELGGLAVAQEAGQDRRGDGAAQPHGADGLLGFFVVRRQGAVAGGQLLAAGGQGLVQLGRVDLGIALHDLVAQPGLDHEIHLVQQVQRQVGALDDGGVQGGVFHRPVHDHLVGLPGHLRPVIGQQGLQGVVVAALDNGLGERLGEHRPLGDGAQIVLAAGAGDGQQVVLGEGRGRGQHGAGHLDHVVAGERPDQPLGRGFDPGHALGEFGADGGFHLAGELAQHVVEQRHLGAALGHVAGEEQVGHPAQQFAPPLTGGFVGQFDQVVELAAGHGRTQNGASVRPPARGLASSRGAAGRSGGPTRT